jgi:FAD:protein FMN transferase
MKKLGLMVLAVAALFTAGCRQHVMMEAVVMGNIPARITVVADEMSQRQVTRAIEGAFASINDVNDLMSTYVAVSEITQLNQSGPGEMVDVSSITFEVLKESVRYGELTDGDFDITVMPLVELWGFYPTRKGVVPRDEEIENTLRKVGFSKIVLDEAAQKAGFKTAGMRVDLGGIAKGYAVDRAVAVLKKQGVQNGLVEIGGEVSAIGTNKDGGPWRVGLQHPDSTLKQVMAVIELSDVSIATSGDYQNFFEAGGVRYSHIIDPSTGRPVKNNVCSMTVIAPTCTESDALATAISVMGVKKGMKLIEERSDLEGIIIERLANDALSIHTSGGLKHIEFDK